VEKRKKSLLSPFFFIQVTPKWIIAFGKFRGKSHESLSPADRDRNTRVSRTLSSVHEAVSPKRTKNDGVNGGITGSIAAASTNRILDHMVLDDESVVVDVGSGAGRFLFYTSVLPIRAAIGFDVDPLQTLNAFNCRNRLCAADLNCPVGMFAHLFTDNTRHLYRQCIPV
jgi:hypothetical protein